MVVQTHLAMPDATAIDPECPIKYRIGLNARLIAAIATAPQASQSTSPRATSR